MSEFVPRREHDDRILSWVISRHDGQSPAQIAKRDGVSKSSVEAATNAVMEADRAESGEEITGAYW